MADIKVIERTVGIPGRSSNVENRHQSVSFDRGRIILHVKPVGDSNSREADNAPSIQISVYPTY